MASPRRSIAIIGGLEMDKRVIVRTTSNLSFSGENCALEAAQKAKGILLKTSPKSEIKVWIPAQEINCVILPGGQVIPGKDFC